MKRQGRSLSLALTAMVALPASLAFGREDGEVKEEPALAAIFEKAGVRGTFAMLDLATSRVHAHDAERARKRFVPASTFKIPNALISLECGSVKNVDEVVPYGGGKQFLPEWEHDMPLREAMKLSAVPIFQEVARRNGIEKMREWLKRMNYGNQNPGTVVDRFWLDGPLEISAIEQTRFLAALVQGRFEYRPENFAQVADITRIDRSGAYTLHGKTGWYMKGENQIGWWVGWIERDGKPAATFALNIDIPSESAAGKAAAAKRIPTARACLEALGAWPPPKK